MSDSPNPMAAMLPIAQAKLDLIAELDRKLVKFHGTMAEWLKKGADSATATSVADLLAVTGTDRKVWVKDTFSPITSANTYGDFVTSLRSLLADTEQLGQDLVMAYIRANSTDQTSEKALLEQRSALVDEVNAFKLVLTDQKVEGADLLVVPDAPKASRSKGGGSNGSKSGGSSKSIRFYRLDGATDDEPFSGSPVYPADSQQKASSIAWYQFNAGIEAMEAAMTKAGWDGLYTHPWQGRITVTSKDGSKSTTKTVGWEISGDEHGSPSTDSDDDGPDVDVDQTSD